MNSPKGVVENCLSKISDPFTLVVLAAYRSQELASGIASCIPTDGSKDALVSLKEISSGKLDMHSLEERMIKSFQKFSFLSEDNLGDSEPMPKPVPAYENAAMHAHALFQKPVVRTPESGLNSMANELDQDEESSSVSEDLSSGDDYESDATGALDEIIFNDSDEKNPDLEEDSDEGSEEDSDEDLDEDFL